MQIDTMLILMTLSDGKKALTGFVLRGCACRFRPGCAATWAGRGFLVTVGSTTCTAPSLVIRRMILSDYSLKEPAAGVGIDSDCTQ